MNAASLIYGAVARWRREWYRRDPARQRRLTQPVISIGNLRVGGSGKTPLVASVARLLIEHGERPSVLSRGYGRTIARDGVTVVSDGARILTGVREAGDEPLMLARALPTVPVLVGANRYLSGRFAEETLDVTVHILDDGFQHFALARDIDLLATAEDDLTEPLLPMGRLREPLVVASQADAALVTTIHAEAATRVGRALGLDTTFRVARAIGVPRLVATMEPVVVTPEERVFAVAAIARPEHFVSDLVSAGWKVVGSMSFRDHHFFTSRDARRVAAAARAAGATIVLTTEKDAVRWEQCDFQGAPLAAVPLTATIEPAATFASWLGERLSAARAAYPSRTADRPARSGRHVPMARRLVGPL